MDNLSSYFSKSLFFRGLVSPEGSNIAPKSDNDCPDLTISGPRSQSGSYGGNDFNILSSTTKNNKKVIKGDFEVNLTKNYSYHWNAETKKSTYFKINKPFSMTDNGLFESIISIDSKNEINIDLKMNVNRTVVGENYDGVTVRDAYYGNNDHHTTSFERSFKEFYKLISPGRLLHYSNESDFVEIYSVENNFNVTMGIEKIRFPKIVYDDMNPGELENDPDYSIIKDLLDSRDIAIENKNKVKEIIKK